MDKGSPVRRAAAASHLGPRQAAAVASARAGRKLRVLVAVGNYPPGHGGGGLRAHRTYKRLMELLAMEVTAVTIGGRGEPRGCSLYEGIEVIRTWQKPGFYAQFGDVGRHILRRGLRPFDLVHAMGMSQVAVAASTWGLLLGIPVVRELTLDGPLPPPQGFVERVQRYGFTGARLLIALSEATEKRLSDAGIPLSRVWTRPNPVDVHEFRPPSEAQRAAARRLYGFTGRDRVHLVLARFQPRKNQAFAVDALARLGPDHKLLLAGPVFEADRAYLAEVRTAIAERGLDGRVVVLPEEVQPAVSAYHAADFYWVPSLREGLPNVMLEALCCGLPVVVNRDLEMRQHVKDGVNGFNALLEAEVFAAAARKAAERLDSPEARARLVEAARNAYAAHTLTAAFAERLAEVLGVPYRSAA